MCLAVSRYGVEVRTALERIRRLSDPVALLDSSAPATSVTGTTRPGNLFLPSKISRCGKEGARGDVIILFESDHVLTFGRVCRQLICILLRE